MKICSDVFVDKNAAEADSSSKVVPLSESSRQRALMGLHYAAWFASVGEEQAARLLTSDDNFEVVVAETMLLSGQVIEFSGREWFVPASQLRSMTWPASHVCAIELELFRCLVEGRLVNDGYDWPVYKAASCNNDREPSIVFNDGTALIHRDDMKICLQSV